MLLVLLLVVAGGGLSRAHVDGFGAPDPYWQGLARGVPGGIDPIAPGGSAAAATHPLALRAYVAGAFALLFALAVRGGRRLLRELLSGAGEAVEPPEVTIVDVVPPSGRHEAGLVLAAAGAIVVGALLVIAPGNGAARASSPDLLPFQTLFRDASPAVQRMYRELQEGLLEAERRRAATHAWPAVERLAAEGIPPFAPARPAYRWRLARDGSLVAYVGVTEPGSPAFLALVQEPAPGAVEPPSTAPLDETHHRLADGTVLHVSIWFRAAPPARDGDDVVAEPAAAGWTQVLAGGPQL